MKNLIRANSLYLGISVLSSSSAILLIPLYISHFSVAEYGELALLNATFSFLAIILTLSLESAFQTFYFDHSEEEVPIFFRNMRSLAMLLALIGIGLLALIGPWFFDLIFSSDAVSFYPNGMLVTVNVAFTLINQIYFVLLRNQEKIKRFGMFVLCNTLVSIVLQVVFIVILEKGVTGALLGMLIANALVFLLTLRFTGRFEFSIKRSLVRKSLKYSLWLMPFFLINWFLAKGDRMIVENYLGLEEVGTYALLMNISMVISLLATSVLNSIRPTLFKQFKNLSKQINREVKNLFLYFLIIVSMAGVAIYFFVQSLDRFSLFTDYLKVQDYIVLALILFSVRAIFRLFSEYLSFLKKSRDLSVISIITAALFVAILFSDTDKIDLDYLLLVLVLVNGVSLVLIIGRCLYLLKTDTHER